MSLIKLAIGPEIALSGVSPIAQAIGTTSAMSGNPLKWVMKKFPKRKLFNQKWLPTEPSFRRRSHELGIATFGNIVNNIRNGKTQDSTRFISAYLDSQLGHTARMGGKVIEEIYKDKGSYGKLGRKLLDKIVKTDGTIDIPKLEKILSYANTAYNQSTLFKNKPLVLAGTLSGGAIGAVRKPNEKNSRFKNIMKGSIEGAGIGLGIKKGLGVLSNKLKPASFAHDAYFEDSYWKDRITNANDNHIIRNLGKFTANRFTSFPDLKKARIARFHASEAYKKDLSSIKKAKNVVKLTANSFKKSKFDNSQAPLWNPSVKTSFAKGF